MLLNFVTLGLLCGVASVTCFQTKENNLDEKPDLAYSEWEPAEGEAKNLPPIIFIHGLSATRITWDDIAPRFVKETGRKAYAVDLPDHGDSPWTSSPSTKSMTDGVINFMEIHGIPKATIVGHSLGGRIAMSLALTEPEKIEKIVVEDIATEEFSSQLTEMMINMFIMMKKAMEMVPSGLDERQAKMFILEYIQGIAPEMVSEITEEHLKIIAIKKENGRYMWKVNIDALLKSMQEGKLSKIPEGTFSGDALFIYGTKSFFRVDSDEVNIKKMFPKAVLVKVEGADHEIHGPFADVYLKEVSKFINNESLKFC